MYCCATKAGMLTEKGWMQIYLWWHYYFFALFQQYKKLLLAGVPGTARLAAVPPLCLGYGMPRKENRWAWSTFALQKFMADGSVSAFFQLIKRVKPFPGAAPTEVKDRSSKSGKMSFLPCILSFTNSFCVRQTRIPQTTEGPKCVLPLTLEGLVLCRCSEPL